jgi:hypothetical protein
MRPAPDGRGSAARHRSDDHPLQRRLAPDNDGMRALTISPPPWATPAEPVADRPPADLHLVEAGRPERADYQQQRRAFQVRCAEIAHLLARIESFEDRVELYRMGAVSRHELTVAAALYPELMPRLNGEWEWIALTLADNEDD